MVDDVVNPANHPPIQASERATARRARRIG